MRKHTLKVSKLQVINRKQDESSEVLNCTAQVLPPITGFEKVFSILLKLVY